MKFTLEINLGNEVMQTGADVGYAIERAAERIQFADMVPGDSGVILDTNGNTVGAWSVQNDTDEDGWCGTCQDPEHDSCPLTPGCPCCEDTIRNGRA